MKKTLNPIIILSFCFLITVNGVCQDTSNFNLTGTRKFIYDHKNHQIEKQTFDANQNLNSFVQYLYDENGNKIETIKYNSDTIMLVRYIYVYSAQNRRVHCLKYDFSKNTEEKRIYKYNESGQVIQTDYYIDSLLYKRVVSEYSDRGDCIKKKSFTRNKLTTENNYSFSYKNGILEEKCRLSTDGDILVETHYQYNDNGTVKSYLRKYHSGSKPNVRREFFYNEKGQCVGSSVYESIID